MPRKKAKNPAAVALGRKRFEKVSVAKRKKIASQGVSSYWATLTPDQRSEEMKRRAAKRKRNKKRSKP